MGKSYLVLHRTEWERLHRKPENPSHLISEAREEYFRKLIEKSQNWIKTWPDTVQGHVEQVTKQKEKRHEDEIATAKKGFHKKKQENTKEAIKRARQMIFDDSSYGRQLLSALRESKNLEIRDIQIEFQKKVREEIQEREKELESKLKLDQCSFKLDIKEQEMKRCNREMEIELANINKSMHLMKINENIKIKEELKKTERENAKLTQEMLEKEAQRKKDYELSLSHDVDYYEKENQLARQRKADREKKEDIIARAQRRKLDERYCKINKVMKQIHAKHDTDHFKSYFESFKKIQQQKTISYNEFIHKGVQQLEEKMTRKEQEEAVKEKLEREKRRAFANSNKLAGDEATLMRCAEKHKCVADRQCIMTKSHAQRNTQKCTKELPATVLAPSKLQELTSRRQQPSPWGGLRAAHAHFAERAGDTLREIRHKRFARKVVDEYRKLNCLDETTLPVSNY